MVAACLFELATETFDLGLWTNDILKKRVATVELSGLIVLSAYVVHTKCGGAGVRYDRSIQIFKVFKVIS